MEVEEIKKMIARGESDTVEFKEYIQVKWEELKPKISQALCALSNSHGGILIIGIRKDAQSPAFRSRRFCSPKD